MTYHTGTTGKYQSKRNKERYGDGLYVRSCVFNDADKERLARVLTYRTGEDMTHKPGAVLAEVLLLEMEKLEEVEE